MCGGGPDSTQKAAEQSQSKLANTMADIFNKNQAQVGPFEENRMKNGLGLTPDYQQQQTAAAFAPARAQLNSRLARMGPLPSGFKLQANTDLDAAQARSAQSSFLQNFLLNDQAKVQGAQMMNPLAFGSQAQAGYGGIMQMPYQPSALGSIMGGAVGGLLGAM